MKCFGFCKNSMNEKSFGPCKNLMKKALDFCKSVMTSFRSLLWTSVQKAFMKTCFGFFAKISSKACMGFVCKRLHDMSSFGVCKCLFFLRTDVSAMQKLMAWIDDCQKTGFFCNSFFAATKTHHKTQTHTKKSFVRNCNHQFLLLRKLAKIKYY